MLAAYTLTYCSLILFSISMNKHFQQIMPLQKNLPLTYAKWIRGGGWVSLALSLLFLGNQFGWANGMVILTGLATLCIFLLALLLNFNPRLIPASLLVLIALVIAYE